MNRLDSASWQRLWNQLGTREDGRGWHERLCLAYAEPPRHYHNRQHLAECLLEFDAARLLVREPLAVELALWFHDAVYDPRQGDNEERSAALARECLRSVACPELAEVVAELVLVTKTHQPGTNPDAALLIDVDLSILGQSPGRFLEYEDQIRREYHFVPDALFATKRAEILQRFLSRPRLYQADYFVAKYEAQARRNLQNSLSQLRLLAGS